MPWFVYVLLSNRGHHYVGSTGRSPHLRLAEHNAGLNRWTRAYRPWRLLYWESYDSKQLALARERLFKTGAGRRLRDSLTASRPPQDDPGRIESA